MPSGIPILNARMEYALRAALELASHPASEAIQSREIAARQEIPGPYLDQILSDMKRAGIVRAVRGAGGGYLLQRPASQITVADIVRAFVGDNVFGEDGDAPSANDLSGADIVRSFRNRLESAVVSLIERTTLESLANEKARRDDALSLMPHL